MTRANRLALACSLVAVLAAGCGPSTSTVAPATSTPVVPPTEGPTLTPATPPPATTAPTTAATLAGAVCGPSDLKASHGLVDGAAGSVFTQVVLEANSSCTVDATPSVGLQDKNGTAVVPDTAASGGPFQLEAGKAYTSTVRFANWCGSNPAFPVSLIIWIDGDKLVVTGGSFPSDGMPGCLGAPGSAATLDATPWAVSP